MKQKSQTVAKTTAPARQLAVWSGTTRLWVVIGLVVLAAIIIYWIRDTFDSLIFALLIAYLLNPLVAGLSQRLRLPRIAAAALIYLALLAAIVVASVTITPILVRQVSNLPREFNHTIEAIGKFLEQSPQLAALGIKADAATLTERIRVELTTLGARVPSVLLGAASSVFSLVFILVMSFYLVKVSTRTSHPRARHRRSHDGGAVWARRAKCVVAGLARGSDGSCADVGTDHCDGACGLGGVLSRFVALAP
jgi:predicted PurR-regulated permease PerM